MHRNSRHHISPAWRLRRLKAPCSHLVLWPWCISSCIYSPGKSQFCWGRRKRQQRLSELRAPHRHPGTQHHRLRGNDTGFRPVGIHHRPSGPSSANDLTTDGSNRHPFHSLRFHNDSFGTFGTLRLWWPLIFGVPSFIICSFPHRVADIFLLCSLRAIAQRFRLGCACRRVPCNCGGQLSRVQHLPPFSPKRQH